MPIAIGGSLGLVSSGGPVGVTMSASVGLALPSPIELTTTELSCYTAVLPAQ
ncbi:MAG: hypothetical protein KC457_08985 [Myxococcales bacterium]|nr:hypothetical protein [Myxococcales bacterium]